MCITFLQHLRVTLVTVEVDKVLCQQALHSLFLLATVKHRL